MVAESGSGHFTVAVVIPALNEEAVVGDVVLAARNIRGVVRVVVCDNGSTDATAARARRAGAEVVFEPRRGYGQACLTALGELLADPPAVVLFMDADGADDPRDAPLLLSPLASGDADLVIGSRLAQADPGALMPQARFGNWLATGLLRALYGVRYTDLGPFRAVSWTALTDLRMDDRDFGWTVQMQARAARLGLVGVEVPVRYRKRKGKSKISGTLAGSVKAGGKILSTLVKERFGHYIGG